MRVRMRRCDGADAGDEGCKPACRFHANNEMHMMQGSWQHDRLPCTKLSLRTGGKGTHARFATMLLLRHAKQ
jgi:hypothetical protein